MPINNNFQLYIFSISASMNNFYKWFTDNKYDMCETCNIVSLKKHLTEN